MVVLTLDSKLDSVWLSGALHVVGATHQLSGVRPAHTLNDQSHVAQDDAGANVVAQALALQICLRT